MSTRTFEELKEAVDKATPLNDASALIRCAEELDALGTREADALAAQAQGVADYLRGNYQAALEHYHRALDIHEELGDRCGVARVTVNIANVQNSTASYPAALEHYNLALAIYNELGERAGVAGVIGNIGNVHGSSGNYSAALEHFHRALAIHEELDDRGGVARVTINIGLVHASTCDYPAALEHYHRALAEVEAMGDRSSVASVTMNIGNVQTSTGNYPAALEHLHRALAIHEEIGDRRNVALVAGNIGNVHFFTGNYPAALEYYHRMQATCEELGDDSNVANVTGQLGVLCFFHGNYPAAVEHFHRALAMHERLGHSDGVARDTGFLVNALIQLGKHSEGEVLLQKMDTMPINDPRIVVSREQYRASLQEHHGVLDEATSTLRAALLIAQEHMLPKVQAEIHMSLRDLALKQSNLPGYVEHNNEFTRITEEINGKDTATKLAMQEKQREIDAREKEHQQHMAVLHSTLPKHIADRVARGETVNDHHENAAVIFLDIVGFTSISDRIPSGHVVHLLEQIFTTLDTVCEKHDVVKIKTIGDSYMAVAFPTGDAPTLGIERGQGGEPRSAVANAATCALDMLSSLDTLEITMPPSLGDTSWTKDVGDIRVRIGIHCGPVTAGVIGTQRMQYDVWGDTVNVASRMESTSEPGRIHVSEAFAAHASPDVFAFRCIKRGEIDIKGKGLMTTYWLE